MLYSRVAHGDSIELGCGISRLRLGSAPEAMASAPVGPMSSDSYDYYSDPNLNTLSGALPGSYPDFPMGSTRSFAFRDLGGSHHPLLTAR